MLSTKLLTELAYLKDDVGFRTAIGTLTSLSLVKRDLGDPLGPVLSVHPLVHEWIRVRLNSSPVQQANFSISATLILYQSFPLDLMTRVYNEPLDNPKGLYGRVDQVMLQLKSVLLSHDGIGEEKFQEYQWALLHGISRLRLLFGLLRMSLRQNQSSAHRCGNTPHHL